MKTYTSKKRDRKEKMITHQTLIILSMNADSTFRDANMRNLLKITEIYPWLLSELHCFIYFVIPVVSRLSLPSCLFDGWRLCRKKAQSKKRWIQIQAPCIKTGHLAVNGNLFMIKRVAGPKTKNNKQFRFKSTRICK